MPELKTTQQKIIAAIAGLVCLDVVMLVLLFSPLIGSQRARRGHMDDLWRSLQLKTKQVEPLRGMDKKIASANDQINTFYKDRLPDQDSDISESLGKVASDSGVQMTDVKYDIKDENDVGLRPVLMEAEFSGGYSQLVRFVNAVERNKLFFIVDSVDLGSQQQGNITLKLGLETYLRAAE
jgi:type IV pilus assembly protein PilO